MKQTPFKIALAQISPRLGDLAANLKMHKGSMAQASAAGARLVLFPELALTGYRLRDLTYEVALRQDSDMLGELAAMTKGGPDLVTGLVEESDDHRFYNAVAYFSEGKLLHLHRKVYLPTYGLFEEGRFMAAGDDFVAFDTPFVGCLHSIGVIHGI